MVGDMLDRHGADVDLSYGRLVVGGQDRLRALGAQLFCHGRSIAQAADLVGAARVSDGDTTATPSQLTRTVRVSIIAGQSVPRAPRVAPSIWTT